jgi:REP element-mobilizing transposase RayT
VILRGNHREALFGNSQDRCALNDIVADVSSRFEIRIHAFCWMSNHLHALLQIADRPLGQVMQRIAARYSRYRHKSLRTTGHLFERRYRAKLVDVDAYFLALLRYIHLNPVKARIVRDPADYPWSSHRAYLGTEPIAWLTTTFGLSLFSTDLARARRAYRQFILQSSADELNPEEQSHPDDPRILGTDAFIASIPLALQTSQPPDARSARSVDLPPTLDLAATSTLTLSRPAACSATPHAGHSGGRTTHRHARPRGTIPPSRSFCSHEAPGST